MIATHAAPPCCWQRREPEGSRPQRGEQYWYLSNSGCDMSRAQGDDEGTDQGRWHVGNVFGSLDQAEQARDKSKEVLLTVHQEHALPRIAKP